MGKLGENVPLIIDKAIDFMASSQAFMEYLNKSPRLNHVPEEVPKDKAEVFLARLAYYRDLYHPVDSQEKER
jgi:hypothetical protein